MPPISPSYCLNCRQQMPGDSPTCPSCGAVVGSVDAPIVRRHRARVSRLEHRIAWGIALLIALPTILFYAGCGVAAVAFFREWQASK